MESDIKLTDYIDPGVIQVMQDAFSDLTGFAALTTDVDGEAVTECSGFCRFCRELNRGCPLGLQLCNYSLKSGAERSFESGVVTPYKCHAGLTLFSTPVIINGKLAGGLGVGGVLTDKPDEEECKNHAALIGADPDRYWEAMKEVPIVSQESVLKAIKFIQVIADGLSNMAYANYNTEKANAEIERAAKMKSDFLANMSHEIRTPMNAVIGMAEMALREDIPDSARSYISQIKSSGRALITIINDILDFSKIESGKMDICPTEYEPIGLFNDVAGIIMTRLIEKNIELILNFNVDMPKLLYGDSARIRQILINLANNAVKFTSSGQVRFVIDFSWIDDEYILLSVSVEDTGIGIKPENLEKIFDSFSQVDSKRNRSVEGTGLGLAISRQLLNLMNGTLHAESEYKKGSVFSFKLPQRVVDRTPAMRVTSPENVLAIGMMENEYVSGGFTWDAAKLGVSVVNLAVDADMELALDTVRKRNPGRKVFVFIDQHLLDDEKTAYFRKNPDVNAIIVADFFSMVHTDIPNLLIVKKPLSAMSVAMILNHICTRPEGLDDMAEDISFTAPDAKILIVEDNSVNLTVAEGLLRPLKMKISAAVSGKEAIRKIEEEHYDLILMDHMMPEMDGVETTRIIRRMYPDYEDVPIIALTANAVSGVKEMFLSEGMNDFVPKPIEIGRLAGVIRKWLPKEKIVSGAVSEEDYQVTKSDFADLDTEEALKFLGSEELLKSVISEFVRSIPDRSGNLEKLFNSKRWADYSIEVHGLKNACRQIGAVDLTRMCAELEEAGRAEDVNFIMENHEKMIKKYRSYEVRLSSCVR